MQSTLRLEKGLQVWWFIVFTLQCVTRLHRNARAGFRGGITEKLRGSLSTTRYQSTAAKATYQEYLRERTS
jgi:hypothetical protein